ncbi:MAG: FMN-binding protein [Candidatus Krumholzibacteria bacterium]|nr:FMN-binding protein [Candidatus Krumholzibacteria bacterium]
MQRIAINSVLVLALFLSADAVAQKRVFLSKEKAIERVLKKAATIRERPITISEEEAKALAEAFGMPILDSRYVFYEAMEEDVVVRRAVIINVIGQYQPITFIVGMLPDGTVERVDIMVYRETRGSEVRRRAFLKQFEEKSLQDPLRVHDDIMNVTGATISSRSVSNGVKLALRLHQRLFAEASKPHQTNP